METLTQPQPNLRPLTTKEDFEKIVPQEMLKNLPTDFFEQLNAEPKGQVVLMPDLNKLFNTILASNPKTPEQLQEKKEWLERESKGQKLWAVKFPFENEGGGVLSYLTTRPLPYRGVPHTIAVERLGFVKRIITTMIKSLPIKFLIIYYGFLCLISRKRFESKINSIFKNFLNYAYNSLSPFRLEDLRYCRCVQETRKVFNELAKRRNWQGEDEATADMTKDTLSLFVENDSAYRSRYQDFWQIADIKILAFGSKKEFLKEINRIFEEVKRRENVRYEKVANWQKKKLLILSLFWFKKYRMLFQEFCQIVDVDKLLFTPEDREWIKNRIDYMFEGKLLLRMIPFWQRELEELENNVGKTENKEYHETLKKHLKLYGNLNDN